MESLREVTQLVDPTDPAPSVLHLATLFGFTTQPISLRKLLARSESINLRESVNILIATYDTLKGQFNIGEPKGPIGVGTGSIDNDLRAHQLFHSLDGDVCIEVYREVDSEPNDIWVCIPKKGLAGGPNPAIYQWFRYQRDASTGSIVPQGDVLQLCPPYPPRLGPDGEPYRPPVLQNSGDWCHRDDYEWDNVIFRGSDPPHWSTILLSTEEPQPFIANIHLNMQSPETMKTAVESLDRARPGDDVDLTDRVMSLWQPVTVRGLVTKAKFPGGDLAVDHTTGYTIEIPGFGRGTPSGDLTDGEISDHYWPGLDWDMAVAPDPDVGYVASVARPHEVGIEIEQFALPQPYRPQWGEWLQATGRWVIDCGHVEDGFSETDGFFTEIHPPELLVSSHLDPANAYGTVTRVIATGAWTASELFFVVYPPPRPVATAILRWTIEDEWRNNAELTLLSWPLTNGNHLIGVISTPVDDRDPLRLHNSGMVGMTSKRGYQAVVKCWWEIPTAIVRVTLIHNEEPARGGFVFYRAATVENATWEQAPVDSEGACIIEGLQAMPYWFRPAGSEWDFADVPRQVELRGGVNILSFDATPTHVPLNLMQVSMDAFPIHREEIQDWGEIFKQIHSGTSLQVNLRTRTFDRPVLKGGSISSEAEDQFSHLTVGKMLGLQLKLIQNPVTVTPLSADPQAVRSLTDALLTLSTPGGRFGVLNNELSYLTGGRLYVHLAGLDDKEGKPIVDASSTYTHAEIQEADAAGHLTITQDAIHIKGIPGAGVAKAIMRIQLLLRIPNGDFRVAGEVKVETDHNGEVKCDFTAGSHVEEIIFAIEVLNNPYNPWFLPKTRTNSYLFHPAKTGDDSGAPIPYGLVQSPMPTGGVPEVRETRFLEKLARRQELITRIRALDVNAVQKSKEALKSAALGPIVGPKVGLQQLRELARKRLDVTRESFPSLQIE